MVDGPSEIEWRTRWARITGFPTDPIQGDVDWWERTTGSPPEIVNANRREGIAQYLGPVDDRAGVTPGTKLLLQIDEPQRYEWRVLIDPDPDGVAASIGSVEAVRETMQWLARASLPLSPELVRLAYGGVLFVDATDQAAALKAVRHLLPFDPRPENTRDLIYRINRRVGSRAIPGRTVNRIQKWSSITAQAVTLRRGASGVEEMKGESRSAVELEFDVNNVPEGSLDPAQLPALLNEFMDIAAEIRARGDIPETGP